MEKRKGYTRYKSIKDSEWNGIMKLSVLTPEKIQVLRFQGYIFEEDFSNIPELKIPKPPIGLKSERLKKSDLEQETNYILCPDRNCGLFWDERFQDVPCERYCPLKEKMQKMILCAGCKEPIYLAGDHFSICRVDHNCKNGNVASTFSRMSGIYRLIYEKPLED